MNSSPLPSNPSRRDFLAKITAGAAVMPLLGSRVFGSQAATAAAISTGPASGGTTLHVMSKPVFKWSYAETARLIADAGFSGIDYTVRVPQGHVLPERVKEDLPRAIEAAHAAGLKVEMITTEIISARQPHAETLLRTAAQLGVKCYRTGNFDYDPKLGVAGTFEKLKPALKELAALNASIGIHGAIQNHSGTRIGSAVWDLYELLRDINPASLGIQYDIRHGVAEGGQSWPVALKLLAPWIRCTDIKDFKWKQSPGKAEIEDVPLGEGIVPLDAYLKLYRELNISGPMSVHFEFPPFEKAPQPLTSEQQHAQYPALMKRDAEHLRAIFAKHKIA